MSETIRPINLEHEMQKSFIAYAMSVITSRALPDVRDGMKPVHRRIMHTMEELGVTPDKPTRKSARIVGDCMGKYHPHGDSSVYDAMVRLAQDFNTRYPLVEGQGNFGSVDGDGAAAMRYTEARLSKMAMELMRDIDKDTVDFQPNFDGTQQEPVVLPARFPNLLVNGSNGIAVGMATNMPPHNLGETIDGLCAMIDNPDITNDELMAYIPGPDFPTGAIILGKQGIAQAYRTGRGKIYVRARTEIEQMSQSKSRIIVTEIPYQVNKASLVTRIAELVHEKKIEGISDLRDETDRNGTRIVIELKKDVNASVVLNNLYKHTDMQATFGVINLALVDGEPKILTLKQILYYYLEHQKDVVTRRTRFDLARAKERLHIIEGLLKALDQIDEVIKTIRSSETGAIAKDRLCERFGFSERQAQAILDMRLQRLTGLERDKLIEEEQQLRERVAYLEEILASEHRLMEVIKEEALDVKARCGDKRRTEIAPMPDDIELDDIIQEEQMTVTMTHFGYIKRTSTDAFKAQNRGGKGVKGQATRDEDYVERMLVSSTHAPIMFFTNFGRVYRIKCYAIPEASRTSKGIPVVNVLQLQTGEKVTAMFVVPREVEENGYLVTATRKGLIKKTRIADCGNIRKGGLLMQTIREGDELISVEMSSGEDEFILASKSGKCIRFNEAHVRPTGRGGMGVRGINLDDDDILIDMVKVIPGGMLLTVTEKGLGKRTPEDQYSIQGRGGKGLLAMKATDKTGGLAALRMTESGEDVLLVRDDGIIMRTPVEQISVIGRNTQGVRLMQVGDSNSIACVALLPHQEITEDEDGAPISEEASAPDGNEPVEAVEAAETENTEE
ncbi:MAG: DNA gyrase subunit A [Clostridia bacterium]|nr:DNA gyrase subunit A [Clostridia bacterium]